MEFANKAVVTDRESVSVLLIERYKRGTETAEMELKRYLDSSLNV